MVRFRPGFRHGNPFPDSGKRSGSLEERLIFFRQYCSSGICFDSGPPESGVHCCRQHRFTREGRMESYGQAGGAASGTADSMLYL